MSYEYLADCYDRFTADVDYPRWADYLEKHFAKSKLPIRTVLDLACGTGSLTCLLAERGYDMTGVDLSPEMLAVAMEKGRELSVEAPLFLCQSMDRLDLYDTVDACVCCLDSVNYVTKPAVLKKAFERVHLFLTPGGVFLFDFNTPAKLMSHDGQMFMDETEDAACIWRAEYSKRRRICTYGMDIFTRVEGDLWQREEEIHEEYAYTPEELTEYLEAAGFVDIKQFGNLSMRTPKEGEERIFFRARKGT